MLKLAWVMCESRWYNWLIKLLVVNIPKRNSLRNIVWESYNVSSIRGDVKIDDSVFMRSKVSSFWSSPNRVPNYKHWVLPWIGSHNNAFILAACCRSNSITMPLKKLLLSRFIIIDHPSVSSWVKDLCSVFSREIVNTLNNAFIESHYPLQIKSIKPRFLFVLLVILVRLIVWQLSPCSSSLIRIRLRRAHIFWVSLVVFHNYLFFI